MTIGGSDGASMNEHLLESTVARGGTVDRVVEGLRAGILGGRYVPGQHLIEADLTRDFNVSRGPLREAFRRLSAEGLLQIVPNRGALVRQLSYREIVEIFQIRSGLEPLAARLAALAIDQGDNRRRFKAAIREIWSEAPRDVIRATIGKTTGFTFRSSPSAATPSSPTSADSFSCRCSCSS
jgi:DNA-binding GntR family transcriptional regulator